MVWIDHRATKVRRDKRKEETKIQATMLKALRLQGYVSVWRNAFGLGDGSPDLVGYVVRGPKRGRFVGFEVKTSEGVVSDDQIGWHVDANQAGAYCCTVRTVASALEHAAIAAGMREDHG